VLKGLIERGGLSLGEGQSRLGHGAWVTGAGPS
jgi:hypothetical protein